MTDAQPLPRLDMGRVVRRTFSVSAANFATFLTLTFLFYSLPSYLLGQAADYVMQPLMPHLGNQVLVFIAQYARTFFVGIPSYISAGAITYGALQSLDGRRARPGECIMFGIRKFAPLFVVGLVASTIEFAGLLLLIIPGLIAAVVLFLVAPAVAIEKAGVLGALRRSSELTRNNRWRMFGLLIAVSFIGAGLSFVVGQVYVQFFVPDVSPHPLNVPAEVAWGLQWAAYAVYAIIDIGSSLVFAALVASIYYEVRTLKEGVFSNALAKVFD